MTQHEDEIRRGFVADRAVLLARKTREVIVSAIRDVLAEGRSG